MKPDFCRWLLFLLLFVLVGCIGCAGCAGRAGKKPDTTLLRAAPSYMHWLQKQSMLNAAPGLIAEVSQTGRAWLQGAAPRKAHVLLEAAPTWLVLRDQGQPPLFAHAAANMEVFAKKGFGGLYLGSIGEKPDIWLGKRGRDSQQNVASLEFDALYGTEADFERVGRHAEAARMELGAALLPGATGQGPDFLLQGRHASGHAGLYAMLPVPVELAPALPPFTEEWDCRILPDESLNSLINADILPEKLARDGMAWASPGGWAVTGAVNGADGVSRRWVYRFAGFPSAPVLAWQDPSGNAAKVMSAAVIRHTGILGLSLAGLHLEPLLGLEPVRGAASASLSPGLDAINDLSRQIHRYGGWALQADPVPVSVLEAMLAGDCDFCRDDVTELLVMFGLLAADGRPVAALYRDWIAKKIKCSRLARGLNGDSVPPLRLLTASPANSELRQTLARLGSDSAPAAIAASIPNGMAHDKIQRFLLSWRLGMPGLAFISEETADNSGFPSAVLRMRKQSGLAAGELVSVTRGNGGGFALLNSLPKGGYWLLACNFGQNDDELKISLPEKVGKAKDAETSADLGAGLDGRFFRMPIAGRAIKNIIFSQ